MLKHENRKFLLAVSLLFLSILVTYKIPHRLVSVSELLIKPFQNGNRTFFTSGIVPFVLFFVGISLLFSLKRYARRSKLLLFLVIIIVIIPFMKLSIDISRSLFYLVTQANFKTIDMEDSRINIQEVNDTMVASFQLELKDYSWSRKEFKVRIYLPEELSSYSGIDVYEPDMSYRTGGYLKTFIVDAPLVFKITDETAVSQLFLSDWRSGRIVYELYNEEEVIKIIDQGYNQRIKR